MQLSQTQLDSVFKQGMIFALHRKGHSIRQIEGIMKQTNYSYGKSTIQNYISAMEEEDYHPIVHQKDVPLSYSVEQKNKIIDMIEEKPETSLRDIQQDQTLNHLHFTTIRNLLKSEGYSNSNKARTFLMTDQHIHLRWKFAVNREYRTKKFWRNIWFSDESKLFSQRKGRDTVWIKDGKQKIDKKYLKQEEKYHGGLEISVFGAISEEGGEYLEWYTSSLNSENYQQIIQKGIVGNQNFSKENHIFMQDNASCHTSKSTLNFLKNQNIQLIDWPTKGADINPIELIWAELKGYLYKNQEQIQNKEDIWLLVSEYFSSEKITKMTKKLYENQHKKINQLIKVKER